MITFTLRHLGPGPHPAGSPQSTHGGDENGDILAVAPIDERKNYDQSVLPWSQRDDGWRDAETARIKEEGDRVLREEFGRWAAKLDAKQQFILGKWLGGYSEINYTARRPDFGNAAGYVDMLDHAMTHELSKPAVVYRGLRIGLVKDLEVGDVYRDDGFESTSLCNDVAEAFAAKWGADSTGRLDFTKGAVCRLSLPAGTRCATPVMFGQMGTAETEILLPRQCQFRVDKIWTDEHTKLLHVEMTLIHGGKT